MKRDDEGYKGFVIARYPSLVRAAVLFGCNPQDAEDATQEALIKCYRAWSRVTSADDPDAYVYRVLVNGISRGRRRKWRGELPHAEVPEQSTADPAVRVSVSHTVRESLRRLAPEQRQVLVLRYFADLTENQIADILGIAPGTVKSRSSRAIATLAQDASLGELLLTRHEEDR